MSLGPRAGRFVLDNRRPILLAVGVAALALAGAVVVAPGGLGLAAGSGARALVVLAGIVAGALGVWTVARLESDGQERFHRDPFARTPEHVEVGVDATVGADLDEALDRYAALSSWREARGVRDVRDRLGEEVVRTVMEREGVRRVTAVERLSDGSWTDEPLAAELFAEPGTVTRPLDERIVQWARGDRFARQVAAAMRELDRLRDGRGRDPASDLDGGRTDLETVAARVVGEEGQD